MYSLVYYCKLFTQLPRPVGNTGGSLYSDGGGAAEYVCLPPDPTWNEFDVATKTGGTGRMYGAEYKAGNHGRPFFGSDFQSADVPCTVCRSTARATVLMIPGRAECYSGWHQEYTGYLMSGSFHHRDASEFICVDSRPEKIPNSSANQNGKLMYFVEGHCGSLPCPPYHQGRELACVVCTK
jgi:hypothetical protein